MAKVVKARILKPGRCPICGARTYYNEHEVYQGEALEKIWECPKCKNQGSEWHKLEYQGHDIADANGNLIPITKVGEEIILE